MGGLWLRHCVLPVGRSRDRIPVASVTGICLVDTDRTMCPGVNSASKKCVPGIPLGVKATGAWGWRPTTLVVPNVKKSGALTYLDPLGPSRRPVVVETFTLYIYIYIYVNYSSLCYMFRRSTLIPTSVQWHWQQQYTWQPSLLLRHEPHQLTACPTGMPNSSTVLSRAPH